MNTDKAQKKKQTLCEIHEKIDALCEEIAQADKNSPHFKRQVSQRVGKIKVLSASAKYYGQRMEDRLQEYYEGIVGLGFLRTK